MCLPVDGEELLGAIWHCSEWEGGGGSGAGGGMMGAAAGEGTICSVKRGM